jgi:hypothetical protein
VSGGDAWHVPGRHKSRRMARGSTAMDRRAAITDASGQPTCRPLFLLKITIPVPQLYYSSKAQSTASHWSPSNCSAMRFSYVHDTLYVYFKLFQHWPSSRTRYSYTVLFIFLAFLPTSYCSFCLEDVNKQGQVSFDCHT